MSLPTALEGLEAAADKLHRETYPDLYPAEGKTETAPPETTPPAEPPAPEPTAPPAPETPPAAPPEPATMPEGMVSRADYDALQHKFEVLQGKYNAEVPRTAAELKALRDEIAALKQTRPAPPTTGEPAPPAPTPEGEMGDRLQRLEQEYGPEFMQDMEAFFRSKFGKDLQEVRTQVDSVVQHTARTVDDQYVADLSKAVPDWQTVVNDPKFAAYMNEEEGRTGISRLTFAKEFQKRRDAGRVAAYYLDFKQRGSGTPTPPKPTKEALVAPTTTPTGAAPATGGGEVQFVRASELDKFARDVIAGVYRGREKEQAAIQARHDAAQAAGKILPG